MDGKGLVRWWIAGRERLDRAFVDFTRLAWIWRGGRRGAAADGPCLLSAREQLSQNVWQNAAVLVVEDFLGGIDADDSGEPDLGAVPPARFPPERPATREPG